MNLELILAVISSVEVAYGIPPGLLRAICTVESGLNPAAINYKDGKDGQDSIGLCQIKYGTARSVIPNLRSPRSLQNPLTNAAASGAYLKKQYQRYGEWNGAIIAYNKGRWDGGPTNRYYRKVMHEYERIKNTDRRISGEFKRGSANAAASGRAIGAASFSGAGWWTHLPTER